MNWLEMSAWEIALTIIADLCITVVFYLLVPVIITIKGKKYTERQLKRIITINCVVVWSLFAIYRIANDIEGTSAAVFLWGWVGYLILKKRCLTTDNSTQPMPQGVKSTGSENNYIKWHLENSYDTLHHGIKAKVFPNGKSEYIYVGTILNTLFKNRDIFKLIQIYASVYTYYKLELGNSAKTFVYAKKKAESVLTDDECKLLIGAVMLNTTQNKSSISNPAAKVYEYKEYIESYINTVEGIQKNFSRFMTRPAEAGSIGNPILVAGICGVREYVDKLRIPGIEKVKINRTSSISLTDEYSNVSYAIDEYTLTNSYNGGMVATLWFNIYGTENTNVLPACFADKTSIPYTMDVDSQEELANDVVVCSKCKSEIPATSRFCQYCGQKQTMQEKTIQYCRECGKKLKNGYVFCNICGTRVIQK